jgi:hypothetical protein
MVVLRQTAFRIREKNHSISKGYHASNFHPSKSNLSQIVSSYVFLILNAALKLFQTRWCYTCLVLDPAKCRFPESVYVDPPGIYAMNALKWLFLQGSDVVEDVTQLTGRVAFADHFLDIFTDGEVAKDPLFSC